MAYSDNSFDAVWEELRKGNPELIAKVDQRVAEIRSREKQRGCPPDCNPGFCDDPDEEICDRCWASWEKRKPKQTNADRLRSMTDEELAELLSDIGCCEYEHMCAGECKPCHNGKSCQDYWLDWLRQEARE